MAYWVHGKCAPPPSKEPLQDLGYADIPMPPTAAAVSAAGIAAEATVAIEGWLYPLHIEEVLRWRSCSLRRFDD
jgi:hypothetical protein